MSRSKSLFLILAIALLSSCASRLEPIQLSAEHASQAANTQLWVDLESVHSGNWHHLLNDGATALDWRLRAIDSASQSIELQSFLWEFDAVGKALSDHILAAADRGVRTRILIDDSFLYMTDANISKIEAHPNIEFRIFNPYKRRSSSLVTRELLNLGELQRLNHRMHNKVMIIDGRIALLGGRNIADQYFGLHDTSNFRDMELIVGGPIIGDISKGFDQYWNDDWSFPAEIFIAENNADTTVNNAVQPAASIRHIHPEESLQERSAQWINLVKQAMPGTTRLLLDNPPLKNPAMSNQAPIQLGSEIIALIENAKSDIWIISAYLIPTSPFERAIEEAENRGVEVHILTNSIRSNNHISAHSAYRKHVHRLLAHGADLYEIRIDAKDRGRYMQEPLDTKTLALHAKVMIVDRDIVFIGSANFDPRSLRINTEMGLVINSEAFNQQLRAAIAQDFLPRNAWHLRLGNNNQVEWVSDERTLKHQPAQGFMQNIEDWFFAHLPIENEM